MTFADYIAKETEDFISTFFGALDNWKLSEQFILEEKQKKGLTINPAYAIIRP